MAEYKTEHDNLDKMSVEDRVSAASDHTEINCFELKNVCAGYDTNNVLHDISIRLPAGRNVCILGENGCGKTTLLRTMTGLLPYSGQILLDGHDLRKMKRKERIFLI